MAATSEPPRRDLFARIRNVTESDPFEGVIATLIVLNALLLVVELSPAAGAWEDELWLVYTGSQAVFVVEIVLRVLACGPRVGAFFKEPWNVFDFAIVALTFVPLVGAWSLLGRLVRLVRVLRLVSLWRRRAERGPS